MGKPRVGGPGVPKLTTVTEKTRGSSSSQVVKQQREAEAGPDPSGQAGEGGSLELGGGVRCRGTGC